MAGSGAGTWADRATTTVTNITDDVTTVKSYISNIVAAAGTNDVYRAIFFPINYTGSSSYGEQISPLLSDVGLNATGGVTANGFIYTPDATAYNITTQTLSGSTQFGDSTDDTHQFIGHITASGNISASGEIIGTMDGGSF